MSEIKEVVYYDILEDKLSVYLVVPWVKSAAEIKTRWGDVIAFHVILLGDL